MKLSNQSDIYHSNNPRNSPVINKAHIVSEGEHVERRTETKEHVFLNRHVKRKDNNRVTPLIHWFNAEKEQKKSWNLLLHAALFTYTVDTLSGSLSFWYKFHKNNAAFANKKKKTSCQGPLCGGVAVNPCYADEGFKRKSWYNGVILGDLSKILQSSSFIALHLVPRGCSTHGGWATIEDRSVPPTFLCSGYE